MGKGLAAPPQVPLSRRRNRTTRPSPIRVGGKPAAAAQQHKKPSYCDAGSTNGPGARARSAWSTTGALPKNGYRKPKNSASAGTAASLRSRNRRAAPRAPRPTGSPAGAATPGGGQRPKLRRQRRKAVYYREQAGLGHRGVFGPSPEDSSTSSRRGSLWHCRATSAASLLHCAGLSYE